MSRLKKLEFNSSEQRIFFTSDTHFYHTNIIRFCHRPFESVEEMNETMIERWNEKVGKDDIIFHLGDFAFCGSSQYKKLLDRLNGKIYLALGNHDWRNINEGCWKRFEEVSQQYKIKIDEQRIYLNHFPFLCYDRHSWQLFGHVHSGELSNDGKDIPRLSMTFPTQMDVGVDSNNFEPYSWEDIKRIIMGRIIDVEVDGKLIQGEVVSEGKDYVCVENLDGNIVRIDKQDLPE